MVQCKKNVPKGMKIKLHLILIYIRDTKFNQIPSGVFRDESADGSTRSCA